jgi:PhzF family phenazine biosynthesis protein
LARGAAAARAYGRNVEVLRYTAFSTDPAGGNPAGVVLDASGAETHEMQKIAADVGYSETAFLVPTAPARFDVRYFSPLGEVAFCGHATIAAAVAWAERHGTGELSFAIHAGPLAIGTSLDDDRQIVATLTSVEPAVRDLAPDVLDQLLTALGWNRDDLDPALPPKIGYAGVYHPIIAAGSLARLADLDYDYERLAALMAWHDWTTVDLVSREDEDTFRARNPFPPGGVVEDPATGAAAAAFGGYLRALGLVRPPARVTVRQGVEMGRPGVLTIDIPATGGIQVSGAAVRIS